MEILSKIKNWYNKNKKELTKVVTVGVIVSDILSYLFFVIASLSAYLKTFILLPFFIFILLCLFIPLFLCNIISRIKLYRNNEILTKYSKNIKKIESSEILFSLISNKDSIKIEQNKFLNKDDK